MRVCHFVASFLALAWALPAVAQDSPLPLIDDVEPQPLKVHVKRLREALDYVGNPLSAKAKKRLDRAERTNDPGKVRALIQEALDP